ncbi:MAG: flagellar motor protein MotB [Betaproteobacteria bacterium]
MAEAATPEAPAEATPSAPREGSTAVQAEGSPPAEAAQGSAEAPPAEQPATEEAKEGVAPVIVIKKVIDDGHGGAHGGAWKIALADMMTAMMAFFLLMWLLGATNADQRKSIADYFKPTSHSNVTMGKLAGSNGILGGKSIIDTDGFPFSAKQTAAMERLTPKSEGGPTANDPNPNSTERSDPSDPSKMSEEEKKAVAEQQDKAAFEKLEKEIREKIEQNPRLANLKEQVKFTREKEGLRIDIIDKADFAMFALGGTQMMPRAQQLVNEVAKSLAGTPNKLAVRGHTDAVPFTNAEGRNNWSLSAERAEATRSQMEKQGVSGARFARIEGVADTMPFNPNDPLDPRNRRMSVTVLHRD